MRHLPGACSGLSYSALGDVWSDAGREGAPSLAGMEPVGFLWRLLDAPGLCGVKSPQRSCWFLGFHDFVALPALGPARKTMSPGEFRHPLSFEGREVTARVTGPASVSSCSPLAFRI